MSGFLQKLRELSLWQVVAIYVGAAWAVLQAADLFIDRLGFPEWLFRATLVLLIVGLPVIVATAALQQANRKSYRFTAGWSAGARRILTWRNAVIAGVLAFALLGAASVASRAIGALGGNSGRSRATALTELDSLVEATNWEAAWPLLRRLDEDLSGDSSFEALRALAATRVTFHTQPAGAKVYHRFYGGTDTTWQYLGQTPLDSIWFPNGTSQLRIERDGYRTVWRSGAAIGPPFFRKLDLLNEQLDVESAIPAEMVRIPGGMVSIQNPPLDALPRVELSDYLMDKYEVTNREFKRFVDAGGYRRRDYWKEPFQRAGRSVSWDDALRLMVDRTGRPGPGTWEAGAYPEGEDNWPVAGVNWYEAQAYAEFAGKSLPTVYHWSRTASTPMSVVMPRSNFGNRGPRDVTASTAMGWYGTYDQGGNVREWCLNESNGDRYIMGGGWTDPAYHFNDAYTQPAWDRSSINGIRLVKYLDPKNFDIASRSIALAQRDFRTERPVSDEVFAVFRSQFAYDRKPLNERIESVDSSHADWVKQRVSFDAAYSGPRMLANIYLPKRSTAPQQVVIFFPPGNALQVTSSATLPTQNFDFLIKSGRAVVFPIYRGTFERGAGELNSDYPEPTVKWRDYVVLWGKDYRRTIDYIETRQDLDVARIAYYGQSFGGAMGAILAAIEPRTKAVVLNVGGLNAQRSLPDVDQINYVPRVTQPILMLNGRYDHFFPVETTQLPMFDLLGTPAKDKRHVLFEGGHMVPRPDLIRETLGWLDKYLGQTATAKE